MSETVAIIGGGVTGLTLAWSLKRAGRRVAVFEQAARAGGWIQSERKEGFLLEHGPNTIIETESLTELIHELGIDSERRAPEPEVKRRFVLSGRDGKKAVTALPSGLLEASRSPILSTRGKLRALLEPLFASRAAHDESVQEFFLRRFGVEFVENVIAPVVGGIYAANPAQLSSHAAFPKLIDLAYHHRSLLFAALRSVSSGKRKRRTILAFKDGLQTLTDALAARLQNELNLNCPIARIAPQPPSGPIELLGPDERTLGSFDQVYLTTPAKPSARLLSPFDSEIASDIAAIPHAAVGLLHLAFPKSALRHPLNGFGVLVPPHLSAGLLGIVFSSSLFPERSPADQHLVTCITGGALFPERADVEEPSSRETVLAEICEVLQTSHPPLILSAAHLPSSIPNYPVGHLLLEEKLQRFERENHRIRISAQWRSGIGVPDRVASALRMSRYTLS